MRRTGKGSGTGINRRPTYLTDFTVPQHAPIRLNASISVKRAPAFHSSIAESPSPTYLPYSAHYIQPQASSLKQPHHKPQLALGSEFSSSDPAHADVTVMSSVPNSDDEMNSLIRDVVEGMFMNIT